MKTSNTILIAVIAGILFLSGGSWSVGASALTPTEIRAITEEATIWGFPIVANYKLLSMVFDPRSPLYGRFNILRHRRSLNTAKDRTVVGPNNDTVYSIAILDLGSEPMVFHVPDMGGRYYAFQFIDLEATNIGYIGTRATGNQEGWYGGHRTQLARTAPLKNPQGDPLP